MMTPDSRQAFSGVIGEQLCLFDKPPFCPTHPSPSSLSGVVLATLLRGEALTHPAFLQLTGSWRLAAYVKALRDCGWPVESEEVRLSPTSTRTVARYFLPSWAIQEARGCRGLNLTLSQGA